MNFNNANRIGGREEEEEEEERRPRTRVPRDAVKPSMYNCRTLIKGRLN